MNDACTQLGFDSDGNFVGYDTSVIGQPVKDTDRCWNCGTKSVDGVYVRGRSVRCPRWYSHHLGSTCKICGSKD